MGVLELECLKSNIGVPSFPCLQLEVRLLAKCEEAREGIRGWKFKKKELGWGNMVGLPGALKINLIRRPGRIECVLESLCGAYT